MTGSLHSRPNGGPNNLECYPQGTLATRLDTPVINIKPPVRPSVQQTNFLDSYSSVQGCVSESAYIRGVHITVGLRMAVGRANLKRRISLSGIKASLRRDRSTR